MSWSGSSVSKSQLVNSGDTWCVPLSHNPTPMWIRPIIKHVSSPTLNYASSYLYCAQPLDWRLAARQAPEDSLQLAHVCHSNTQVSYRFVYITSYKILSCGCMVVCINNLCSSYNTWSICFFLFII